MTAFSPEDQAWLDAPFATTDSDIERAERELDAYIADKRARERERDAAAAAPAAPAPPLTDSERTEMRHLRACVPQLEQQVQELKQEVQELRERLGHAQEAMGEVISESCDRVALLLKEHKREFLREIELQDARQAFLVAELRAATARQRSNSGEAAIIDLQSWPRRTTN